MASLIILFYGLIMGWSITGSICQAAMYAILFDYYGPKSFGYREVRGYGVHTPDLPTVRQLWVGLKKRLKSSKHWTDKLFN